MSLYYPIAHYIFQWKRNGFVKRRLMRGFLLCFLLLLWTRRHLLRHHLLCLRRVTRLHCPSQATWPRTPTTWAWSGSAGSRWRTQRAPSGDRWANSKLLLLMSLIQVPRTEKNWFKSHKEEQPEQHLSFGTFTPLPRARETGSDSPLVRSAGSLLSHQTRLFVNRQTRAVSSTCSCWKCCSCSTFAAASDGVNVWLCIFITLLLPNLKCGLCAFCLKNCTLTIFFCDSPSFYYYLFQ